MNNFLKSGKVMTYTAPAGGVTTGLGYLIGALFVVATNTVAAALPFEGETEGVFTLPKTITEGDLVEGVPLYWNVATGKVSIDPIVGLPIGTLATAALTADTTCSVRLHGLSLAGRMISVRKRFTAAQFNAGATLVPAIPGIKVRMVDAFAMAYGGAVGAVTTADILATLVTVSRKLVAFGQAALTQSTMVRAGAAGGVILADGASFTANDAGAAITVLKTGADITVATGIDVTFTYSLE